MKNRKITWILLVLVAAIWGTIAYQLYASITERDADVAAPSVGSQTTDKDVSIAYVYLKDVRDPFRYGSIEGDSTKRQGHTAQKTVWVPPPVKLTGILAAGKRKTAMLQTNDGAVHFLRVGDTLRGVRVLKISGNSVGYQYQKKNDEWSLPRQ